MQEDPNRVASYSITDAPTSHTDDLGIRYRKYVISMLIRTGCFIAFVLVDHWIRWFFVAGAIFLPYVAVVLANAGRESRSGRPETFDVSPDQHPAHHEQPRQLPVVEAKITGVHSPSQDR